MTEMFGEAWSPMSVPDLAPDDDDDDIHQISVFFSNNNGCKGIKWCRQVFSKIIG